MGLIYHKHNREVKRSDPSATTFDFCRDSADCEHTHPVIIIRKNDDTSLLFKQKAEARRPNISPDTTKQKPGKKTAMPLSFPLLGISPSGPKLGMVIMGFFPVIDYKGIHIITQKSQIKYTSGYFPNGRRIAGIIESTPDIRPAFHAVQILN